MNNICQSVAQQPFYELDSYSLIHTAGPVKSGKIEEIFF